VIKGHTVAHVTGVTHEAAGVTAIGDTVAARVQGHAPAIAALRSDAARVHPVTSINAESQGS